MKISREQYDEMAARVAAGTESDDDRRLVALYADEVAGQDADKDVVGEDGPEVINVPAGTYVERQASHGGRATASRKSSGK